MIDHVFKKQMDRFWDRAGHAFAAAGLTPNIVTATSLVCVLGTSAAFAWHRNYFWFAASAGLFELLDNVDGAIARVAGSASAAGAYFDAVSDRFKELALFAAVGYVSGAYLPAILALGFAQITSYTLARARAEGASLAKASPPLIERLERISLLCVGAAVTGDPIGGRTAIEWTLWILTVGGAITAAQRMSAALRELRG